MEYRKAKLEKVVRAEKLAPVPERNVIFLPGIYKVIQGPSTSLEKTGVCTDSELNTPPKGG